MVRIGSTREKKHKKGRCVQSLFLVLMAFESVGDIRYALENDRSIYQKRLPSSGFVQVQNVPKKMANFGALRTNI